MVAERAPGVYAPEKKRLLLTRNLTPGKTFFEYERTWKEKGAEYRVLDPKRSKLGAALAKGLQQTGIRPGASVLYLGASHGYTPSYVSDIVGEEGFVLCLDFAPRVVRDLVLVCEARQNMAPLMADATKPESYAERLPEFDAVYQDVAQKGQLAILLKNCDRLLKQGGYALLAVKARSEDVTKKPSEVYKAIRRELENGEASKRYVIVDYRELDPFEKDHAFFVLKKR